MSGGPLKTSQAAEKLGLSKSRIRQYVTAGTLAAVRDTSTPNQDRLISAEDVERLRKIHAAAAKPIACAFCGKKIPQHRKYCEGDGCRKRRLRLRQQRYQARRHGYVAGSNEDP